MAGERPLGEIRQLPVKSGRQIQADLANLLFDEVVVVDEPLRRRRNRTPLVDRLRDGAMRREENTGVGGKPLYERMASVRLAPHRLGARQAPRMLFEALGAEELFANGFPAIPERRPWSAA
jgi:hypothetical protein